MAQNARVKISNHPLFEDVERWVIVDRLAINADVEQMVLEGRIEYRKNGVDVTTNFKRRIPNWIVGNHYKVAERDINGDPVPNPDYDENDPESEEFIMHPAFDYYHGLMLENVLPPLTLLTMAILGDDAKGEFNF